MTLDPRDAAVAQFYDPRTVLDAWEPILSAARPANQGHPVKTDRGEERLYTIQATGRDLDDLRAALGAWKAERDRLALAESTRHHGSLLDEAKEAIRRVADDASVSVSQRIDSIDLMLTECDNRRDALWPHMEERL